MINHSIIEKVQKLLTLANSDNEHEAKSATRMANELLLKYNISIQSVTDHQCEYEAKEISSVGLTLSQYQKQIAQLLIDYFFVRIIISKSHTGYSSGQYGRQRSQYKKTIQLVGTKENCQIASYIFAYLNEAYPKLWKERFDRDASLVTSDKVSYFTGLTYGIGEMLKATKWKVQEETGLVLVKDPKLDEFVKSKSNGTYGSESKPDINPKAFSTGVKDGAKVTLRKPIENNMSQDKTKRLMNSK